MTGGFTMIGLITRREIQTRVKSKAFVVSTAIMLLIAIGGSIVLSFVVDRDEDAPPTTSVISSGLSTQQRDAITAVGTQIGSPIHIVEAPAAETKARVDRGSADAAIVVADGAVSVYSESDLSSQVQAAIRSGLTGAQVQTALADARIDPAAVAAASEVTVERASDSADREKYERIAIAMIGLILLTYTIMQAGPAVSTGVIEEKSSRIVEILLATVRPGQLMAGKIAGIGIVNLLQLVLFAVAGVITATAVGLLSLPTVALSTAAVAVVGFILGYLFFAALFAAAGSLVSRVEDSAATVTPITMFAFISIYSGLFVVLEPESALAPYLTWIPPFSVSTVPIRIALGDLSMVDAIGPTAVMSAATVGVILVAARVYRRSVLYSGAKLSWAKALRGR